MRATQFALLTGSILTIALVLITIIFVPPSGWDTLAVSSFILVLATFCSFWVIPCWFAYRDQSNAITIGSLGPAGLIFSVAVVIAILAFLLALTVFFKIALAAFVVGVAFWLSGIAILAFSGSVIASSGEAVDLTRETGLLVARLSDLSREAPSGELRARLSKLADLVQYGPTPHPEAAPFTKELMDLMLANPVVDLGVLLPQLEVAAERRKSALLRVRSRV
jgi:hypothetical protein